MSTINTNQINVNYPVPGVNNNSQGFRDNFASIVTNLNAAGAEITDLQNKVVLKQALIGTTINNDMANTLISNASTRSFRATTYNLGNALAGTVLVNVSLGDVQYGTIAGDTTINFGSWAPSGTQSNVQLNLSISNNISTITFPSGVTLSPDTGATTLENYSNSSGNLAVTVPNGVSQLNYIISTTDCGNSLYITPINRPRISTAIQQRSPIPTGFQGDVAGDVAVDANYIYVCSGSYDATTVTKTGVVATYAGNLINCTSTTSLVTNAPIIFTGTSFGGIVANTAYYIKSIPDGANITISATGFDGSAGAEVALSAATGSMAATSYNGSNIWKAVALSSTSDGDSIVFGNLTVDGWANVSGQLVVSSVGNLKIPGGTNGYVLQTDGTGNLSWSAISGGGGSSPVGTNTEIQYNNSGNFGATIGFTFDKTTGLLSVPGAITATGNVTGSNFIGPLANGNSNVKIATANGNVTVAAVGNTTLTISGTGVNVAGTGNFSGNVNAANLIGALANSSSNITIASAGSISHYIGGNSTSQLTVTATGANIPGTANVVGNANVGNLGTAGLIVATGNITGGNLVTLGNANIGNGNIGGNLFVNSNAAIGNISTGGILNVAGNANVGNLGTAGQIVSSIATGTAPLTVTSTTRVANLSVAYANVSDYDAVTLVSTGTYYPEMVSATSGNLASGANANLSFNVATGNLSTTLLNVTSNANVGNIGSGIGVFTGNVSAANTITSAYAIGSVGTAIAAAGTVQANATAITKDNNIVSTVVVGAGVVLPTAVAGMRIYIKNISANALLVYPATSGIINSLAANAAYSQAANASAFYISSSTTQWYSY